MAPPKPVATLSVLCLLAQPQILWAAQMKALAAAQAPASPIAPLARLADLAAPNALLGAAPRLSPVRPLAMPGIIRPEAAPSPSEEASSLARLQDFAQPAAQAAAQGDMAGAASALDALYQSAPSAAAVGLEDAPPEDPAALFAADLDLVGDRDVFARFLRTGDNAARLGRLRLDLTRRAGLGEPDRRSFAAHFNHVIWTSLQSQEPLAMPTELRQRVSETELVSAIRAIVADSLRRPRWLEAMEADLIKRLPPLPTAIGPSLPHRISAMLNELWVLGRERYEKVLFRLLAVPAEDERWRIAAAAKARGRPTRGVDLAAVFFDDNDPQVRRWLYLPNRRAFTADDAAEYVERVADLAGGDRPYLGKSVFWPLAAMRERYAPMPFNAVVDNTSYSEEQLARVLVQGRLARLHPRGGTIALHPRVVSWVTEAIQARQEFDAPFQAGLDRLLGQYYPGLTPP